MTESAERAARLVEGHTKALHSAIDRMHQGLAVADGIHHRYRAVQKAESEVAFAWSRAQKAVTRLEGHPRALELKFKLEDAELRCNQELAAARAQLPDVNQSQPPESDRA